MIECHFHDLLLGNALQINYRMAFLIKKLVTLDYKHKLSGGSGEADNNPPENPFGNL